MRLFHFGKTLLWQLNPLFLLEVKCRHQVASFQGFRLHDLTHLQQFLRNLVLPHKTARVTAYQVKEPFGPLEPKVSKKKENNDIEKHKYDICY